MSGFAGILNLAGKNDGVSEELLRAMSSVLKHRGPDLSGVLAAGPCGMAHHQLNVTDFSPAARQPMTNENGQVCLVFNGEIYNYRELRKEFALDKKHHFRSQTDTEVIIHLYEEVGIDCLQHLNGMFALALWDGRQGSFYLARDPYGAKPLFYRQTGEALWFASEIKALLGIPGFEPRPNLEALYHYLSFNYIPGNLTAFAGILEFPPGQVMFMRPANARPHFTRFFILEYKSNPEITEKEAVETSFALLTRAVERQLRVDLPVGVMLSGGLDSSALTVLTAKVRGNTSFHTFAIKFDEPSFDESKYARIVAAHTGTCHHEVEVTAEKVRTLLPKCLAYIDEPYADGSAVPTYLLAEYAKEYVTVLLSGEGGDEFFAGYDTYLAYKYKNWYLKVPPVVRNRIIKKLVQALPVSHKKLSFDFKAKRFVSGAELDPPAAHLFWRVVLTEELKRQVLSEEIQSGDFFPSVEFFSAAFQSCAAEDELHRLMYIDLCYHLPGDLMIKNDRMTMAHSLEARLPFTDKELVTYLSTVPVRHKFPGKKRKHLLRSALRPYLPREVLNKKKVGLEMPYSAWFRKELREMCEEFFSERKLAETGLFNGRVIAGLWREHQSMRVDHGRFFWGLLNYLLWYDLYIKNRNFRSYLSPPRNPRVNQ